MTTRDEALRNYRPTTDTCSAEEWDQVGDTVRSLVKTAGVGRDAREVRMYLRVAAGLLGWLVREGYDPEPAFAMSAAAIEAHVVTLSGDRVTDRSRLRKLSRGNGYDPMAGVTPTYVARRYQPPYTGPELEALWNYGASLTNRRRGLAICSIVALGAGCGFRTGELVGIDVADVHEHDGVLCVETAGRCVPVRSELDAWVRSVADERSSGGLVGTGSVQNGLSTVARWMCNRPGVPEFSVFRLRSTWLCRHLSDGTPILHLLAWASLAKFDALDAFTRFLPPVDVTCSGRDVANQS